MYLVRPIHSVAFVKANDLGVEAHIGRYDTRPGWDQYVPFVRGVHLPYAGCNLAALDADERERSIRAIMAAIESGRQYPVDRMVVHTAAFESLDTVRVGDYGLMIESFRCLADYARDVGIMLCIENQVLREPAHRRIYGDCAEEWFGIHRDIDRANVALTLDVSHAATSAAVHDDVEARRRALFDFLRRPELIGRVHWSDACIDRNEARFNDMHLVPGQGDLPLDFHRKVKALDAVKLLEQNCSEQEVLQGLAFVRRLD